jgi:hypothetical protein
VDDLEGFASRVQGIADAKRVAPYPGKTSIASVYDQYGKEHDDAGKMDSFKERLAAAHAAGHLQLKQNQQPTAMSSQERARSEVKTEDGPYHQIARSPEVVSAENEGMSESDKRSWSAEVKAHMDSASLDPKKLGKELMK